MDWGGGLKLSAVLEYGFPGFMRTLNLPFKAAKPAPSVESGLPPKSTPSPKRRLSLAFLTDPPVLRVLLPFGLRFIRLTFRLLRLELNCSVSDPDPARLGRWAGYWYAVSSFPGLRRVHPDFRFQDRSSSFRLGARGGFTAANGLVYALAILVSFPWFTLAWRAWRLRRNSFKLAA